MFLKWVDHFHTWTTFFFQICSNNFLNIFIECGIRFYIYPEFFRIFDGVLTKLIEFPFKFQRGRFSHYLHCRHSYSVPCLNTSQLNQILPCECGRISCCNFHFSKVTILFHDECMNIHTRHASNIIHLGGVFIIKSFNILSTDSTSSWPSCVWRHVCVLPCVPV